MPKFPFGGFEPEPESRDDPPWVRLKTIAEYLEDGQAIPPFLAEWLFRAISQADEDPIKLLENLGLKRLQGRPAQERHVLIEIGSRMHQLVRIQQVRQERAIDTVLEEAGRRVPPIPLSRSSVQRLFELYETARDIALCKDE